MRSRLFGRRKARLTFPDQTCDRPFRVLIADDEIMIAMELEACLKEVGFEIVGPVFSHDELQKAIDGDIFEGAILDLGLLGQDPARTLAPLLARKAAIFVLTGYDQQNFVALPAIAAQVTKPAHLPDVVDRLHSLMMHQSEHERTIVPGAWVRILAGEHIGSRAQVLTRTPLTATVRTRTATGIEVALDSVRLLSRRSQFPTKA